MTKRLPSLKLDQSELVLRGARNVKRVISLLKPTISLTGKRKVVFLHIPKTAGQSIAREVKRVVGGAAVSPIRTHSQAAPEDQFPKGYHYYGGHLDWVSMETISKDPFSFSVLRDPKERIASFYFYLLREAKMLKPRHLARKENTGKRIMLSVSADDYFFGEKSVHKGFIHDYYDNFYCNYFATRRMRGWQHARDLSPVDLVAQARTGMQDVSRVYGMSHLGVLQDDLSKILGAPIDIVGTRINVGPSPQKGSRWDDLCAMFERDCSVSKLMAFAEQDLILLEKLQLDEGPVLGRGGDI